MKDKPGFRIVNTITTIAVILFLIFVFTVPGHYQRQVTAAIREKAQAAESAVISGDIKSAQENIESMAGIYETKGSALRLFLHHENLDDMEMSIQTAKDLAAIGESDNLVSVLQNIIGITNHFDAIEGFGLHELF